MWWVFQMVSHRAAAYAGKRHVPLSVAMASLKEDAPLVQVSSGADGEGYERRGMGLCNS